MTRTALLLWDADYPWDVRIEKVGHSLAAAGYQVHILARNLRRSPRFERLGSFHIHRLKALPGWLGRLNELVSFPAFINPVWVHAAIAAVRCARADVIVVRDLPLGPVALFAARWCRIPVVMDVAESYPEMIRNVWTFSPWKFRNVLLRNPWFASVVERFTVRRMDRVLVVVKESKDRLTGLGVDPRKVSVVSNTPVAENYSPTRPIDNGVLRLCYIGLLGFSRGIEVAIRGLAAFRQAGGAAELDIHGTGSAEPFLRDVARQAGVETAVHFHGWLEHKKIPQVLATTHVGVVPHRRCGHWDSTIPNKLFDYMAASRPVLVSDVTPMRRIMSATNSGLVFRDNDPADFATKLGELVSNARRVQLGSNGRDAVLREFNWEQDSRRLIQAVDSLFS